MMRNIYLLIFAIVSNTMLSMIIIIIIIIMCQLNQAIAYYF